MQPILGSHINTVHGFSTVAEYGNKIGAKTCQIYLRAPRSYSSPRRKNTDLVNLANEFKKYKMSVIVHGSLLLNLCHPENSDIAKKSITNLTEDLNDSVTLGALGVVIHMGKNIPDLNISNEEAFNNYVKGVKEALSKSDSKSIIVLETGAGQGTEICTNIQDLGRIRSSLTSEEQKRVKFCLDTCHMYSAGYELGSAKYVDIMDKAIAVNLGWSNVVAIHLNDSIKGLNCHVDRHADINKGKIKQEGLKRFVEICMIHKIPLILETPTLNYENKRYTHEQQIKDLHNWFKK